VKLANEIQNECVVREGFCGGIAMNVIATRIAKLM
jgi:hypothetical protein